MSPLAVGFIILAAMASPWVYDAAQLWLTARRRRAWDAHAASAPGVTDLPLAVVVARLYAQAEAEAAVHGGDVAAEAEAVARAAVDHA